MRNLQGIASISVFPRIASHQPGDGKCHPTYTLFVDTGIFLFEIWSVHHGSLPKSATFADRLPYDDTGLINAIIQQLVLWQLCPSYPASWIQIHEHITPISTDDSILHNIPRLFSNAEFCPEATIPHVLGDGSWLIHSHHCWYIRNSLQELGSGSTLSEEIFQWQQGGLHGTRQGLHFNTAHPNWNTINELCIWTNRTI